MIRQECSANHAWPKLTTERGASDPARIDLVVPNGSDGSVPHRVEPEMVNRARSKHWAVR
jgi:hypothetical protein